MYENGIVSYFNDSAHLLGIHAGMPVKDAAMRMVRRKRWIPETYHPIEVAYQSAWGRVMAMGSVTFITTGNDGDVICAGSHFGRTSAAYSSRFDLRGVICSDAGRCKDDSGISGLAVLQAKRIPGAAVSAESAHIGDGLSTYRDGIFEKEGGEYWKELFCWPTAIVEKDGRLGVVAPVYKSHFFFSHGSVNDDFLGIKGKEKEIEKVKAEA